MNIFITVYHKIRDFFLFPLKLFKKENSKTDAAPAPFIPEAANELESEIQIKATEGVKRDLERMTFDYEVVNAQGQTIKSSFDASTESEVRAMKAIKLLILRLEQNGV